jgi:hypothetical protein
VNRVLSNYWFRLIVFQYNYVYNVLKFLIILMETTLLKHLASDCVEDFCSKKRTCSVVVYGGNDEQRAFVVRAMSGDLPNNLVGFGNDWEGEPVGQYPVNLDELLPKYQEAS